MKKITNATITPDNILMKVSVKGGKEKHNTLAVGTMSQINRYLAQYYFDESEDVSPYCKWVSDAIFKNNLIYLTVISDSVSLEYDSKYKLEEFKGYMYTKGEIERIKKILSDEINYVKSHYNTIKKWLDFLNKYTSRDATENTASYSDLPETCLLKYGIPLNDMNKIYQLCEDVNTLTKDELIMLIHHSMVSPAYILKNHYQYNATILNVTKLILVETKDPKDEENYVAICNGTGIPSNITNTNIRTKTQYECYQL